jgi:hypothetical protein
VLLRPAQRVRRLLLGDQPDALKNLDNIFVIRGQGGYPQVRYLAMMTIENSLPARHGDVNVTYDPGVHTNPSSLPFVGAP